jgi:hypothetical protein
MRDSLVAKNTSCKKHQLQKTPEISIVQFNERIFILIFFLPLGLPWEVILVPASVLVAFHMYKLHPA